MKIPLLLRKYWAFILVGIISLFLGYITKQVLSPAPTTEIVIEMEALPAPSTSLTSTPGSVGQAIYESRCAACHDTGAAGSPKLGDTKAWKARISEGMPLLLQHVIQGYNLMPPRGTCLECSDADLNLAIAYILKKSH